MQVEHVADMQAGDFIQLPTGIWHTNTAAQAFYAEAQQIMRDNAATDPRPQYQVTNEPGNNARLERIR